MNDAAPAKAKKKPTMQQMKNVIKAHNEKNCLKLSGNHATLAGRITKHNLAMPVASTSKKKHRQKAPTVSAAQRKANRKKARERAAAKRRNAAVATVKLEPTSGYGARKGHFM